MPRVELGLVEAGRLERVERSDWRLDLLWWEEVELRPLLVPG